ncbi:hypothetical protein [Thermococcus sp.]
MSLGVDVEAIRDGDEVIADGDAGVVYVRNPRKVLRKFELWKSGHVEDDVVKELREEYLRALNELSPQGLEKVILKAFSLIRRFYSTDRGRPSTSITSSTILWRRKRRGFSQSGSMLLMSFPALTGERNRGTMKRKGSSRSTVFSRLSSTTRMKG